MSLVIVEGAEFSPGYFECAFCGYRQVNTLDPARTWVGSTTYMSPERISGLQASKPPRAAAASSHRRCLSAVRIPQIGRASCRERVCQYV